MALDAFQGGGKWQVNAAKNVRLATCKLATCYHSTELLEIHIEPFILGGATLEKTDNLRGL